MNTNLNVVVCLAGSLCLGSTKWQHSAAGSRRDVTNVYDVISDISENYPYLSLSFGHGYGKMKVLDWACSRKGE